MPRWTKAIASGDAPALWKKNLEVKSTTPPIEGRRQRQLRNLLLDKKFQLKYTSYLVAIAAVLSLSLGVVVWKTSGQLVAQSERNAAQGQEIVHLGQEVVAESRKVSAVVRMNIVKDPVYQDDPDLLAAFNGEASEQDALLAQQRLRLEEQHDALVRQAADLRRFHSVMLWSLALVLLLLVVGIGLAGIFVTHKVAGPIFKMTRHLRDVRKGRLEVPWGLRKGDELVEFFEEFRRMVATLRQHREDQIEELNRAIEQLEPFVEVERLLELQRMRERLHESLK